MKTGRAAIPVPPESHVQLGMYMTAAKAPVIFAHRYSSSLEPTKCSFAIPNNDAADKGDSGCLSAYVYGSESNRNVAVG
jgi:hypothetical protein